MREAAFIPQWGESSQLNAALSLSSLPRFHMECLVLDQVLKKHKMMAQKAHKEVKSSTCFPEDLVWFLAPSWPLTNVRNSNYKGYETLFWHLLEPGIHMVYLNICGPYIYIHKIKIEQTLKSFKVQHNSGSLSHTRK